jgi:hypothetical protein
VASGATPVFCARTGSEIRGTTQISFGAGWETRIAACAPLAIPAAPKGAWLAALAGFAALAVFAFRRERRRFERLALASFLACFAAIVLAAHDPWRLPFTVVVAAALAANAAAAIAVLRVRDWRRRGIWVGLALCTAIALWRIPHPVRVAEATAPAVPALWLDPASWHPRAPHQSLELRDRPVASLAPGAPNWLVLGGSVAFGDGVAAYQAFPAVAQDILRASRDPIQLFNAGVQGWNIRNIDQLMADLGDALPLTGVVLVSILNNATIPIASPAAVGCDAAFLHAWSCNVWRSQAFFIWPKVLLPKPKGPERFGDALRTLLAREKQRGRKIVLMDEIGEIDAGLRIWDTETYREIARSVAAELGVPFYPVSDAVASLPPTERWLDGIHPTPAMHALLGKRLAEILREP